MSDARTTKRRRYIKHEKSFEDRLAEDAERFRDAALKAQPGMERELLLMRVRKIEEALYMCSFLRTKRQGDAA
jgi:hypothetical protein